MVANSGTPQRMHSVNACVIGKLYVLLLVWTYDIIISDEVLKYGLSILDQEILIKFVMF